MSAKIEKAIVILANPWNESDDRANEIIRLFKTAVIRLKKQNIETDIIDLCNEKDFSLIDSDVGLKDSKTLEYQIRINKAQLILFFHTESWQSIPAILKNFIDKVFTSGFAYTFENKMPVGLLNNKRAIAIVVSEKAQWQLKYIYGNLIELFWKRSFLNYCGIKNQVVIFDKLRTSNNQMIKKWHYKIENIIQEIE